MKTKRWRSKNEHILWSQQIPNLFHMVFLIDKKISQTFRKWKRKMKTKIMLQDLFDHNEAIYLEMFMRLVATSSDFKGE